MSCSPPATPGRRPPGLRRNASTYGRPRRVERILERTATPVACPAEEPFTSPGEPAEENATCVGTEAFNGFYGHGIVNALRAVKP